MAREDDGSSWERRMKVWVGGWGGGRVKWFPVFIMRLTSMTCIMYMLDKRKKKGEMKGGRERERKEGREGGRIPGRNKLDKLPSFIS